MRSLSSLAAVIEAAVASSFNVRAGARLKPMHAHEELFLSSDVCVRLARRLSKDPDQLARQILSGITGMSGEVWRHHAGYINIIPSLDTAEVEAPQAATVSSVIIYLPERPADVARSSMARLVSLAILQYWLARRKGWSARLYCGVRELIISDYRDISDLFLMVLDACVRERSSNTRVDREVLDLYGASGEVPCSFFLCPGDVDHTLWREGGRLGGFDEKANIHIPDRGWMAGVDALPESFEYLKSSSMAALALMLHLADEQRGLDVDWNMPLFFERGNLAWSISSVYERLRRLDGVSPSAPTEVPHVLAHVTPHMAFAMRYFDAYSLAAAQDGEIPPYLNALHVTINGILRLLNNPSLRIELARGAGEVIALYRWMRTPVERINAFFYVD